MPPSPTGPNYPSTATDGGTPGGVGAWTNVNNSKVEDGSVANTGFVGPGGGGGAPDQLNSTNFGFNLPSTAIIDGIMLEIKVQTTGGNTASDALGGAGGVYLLFNGGSTSYTNTPNKGQGWPTSALTWLTYGSSTSLWGKTWTPTDINNTNFGSSISAAPDSGTSQINVDSVRITVYWHTAPATVEKRYIYKVFNNLGQYLGNLPTPKSEYNTIQDINTGGTQITIEVPVSPDTSAQTVNTLTDEAGNILTDESSNNLTDEGQAPLMVPGTGDNTALIRNGNKIQVFEISYYYPNGKSMFIGQIQRWEASFGGNTQEDTIKILAYSDGQDFDNYIVRGNPYTYTQDVGQGTHNTNYLISTTGAAYSKAGQTWKVGVGFSNLGAINIALNGTATVTVSVYDSPSLTTLLASVTQAVSVGAATDIRFAFANTIPVTAGNTYFFAVSVANGQSINIRYQNTNVYVNGTMYTASYGGAGGGGFAAITGDLYFATSSGTGSTTATYTAQDPTTGILEPILNDYGARGGLITYNSSSVDATGLSLTYTFNTATVNEGLKSILTLAPSGFYYYVDIGTDTLYFKKSSTTADIVLTKGHHIEDVIITATIENIKNQLYFTGGPTAGVNLYKAYSDSNSIALYGLRLERKSDNRVTVAATADAIGNSAITELKDEQYQTTVTILDKTMDTTLLKLGLIIGFNGFGTFVDNLLAQIVSVNYMPSEVKLTLGIIPKRIIPEFEKITRGLVAEQTLANPSTPS